MTNKYDLFLIFSCNNVISAGFITEIKHKKKRFSAGILCSAISLFNI